MPQNKLSPGPLLGDKGHLAEAGYATELARTYDRSAITASALRIKEWDYYLIMAPRHAIALTIADNGYMGLNSISLLDFDMVWEHTASPMTFFPMGKGRLPATSVTGDTEYVGKHYQIAFRHEGNKRHLTASMENFFSGKPIKIDITLSDPPKDSMVIATPFPGKPKAFYYNQKINCLRAEGHAWFDGTDYVFSPDTAMGVLDWGRGVWTYHNTWYWSSASGWADGIPFGFNLGYGFGDTSNASENMLFYDGTAHKLGEVRFQIPQTPQGRDDFMKPWQFISDDDRLTLDFKPILDRASCTDVKLIKSDQHQVFGRFSGQVVLDDGTALTVKNLMGFAEKVENKW